MALLAAYPIGHPQSHARAILLFCAECPGQNLCLVNRHHPVHPNRVVGSLVVSLHAAFAVLTTVLELELTGGNVARTRLLVFPYHPRPRLRLMAPRLAPGSPFPGAYQPLPIPHHRIVQELEAWEFLGENQLCLDGATVSMKA